MRAFCVKTVSFLRLTASRHIIGTPSPFQRRLKNKIPNRMSENPVSFPTNNKPIVLIGLMGAGKTTLGRRLSAKLEMPFVDSDDEVIKASGCSIADIFEIYGERVFRDIEAKVILRLLNDGPAIIATGGGAFMNTEIRLHINKLSTSVWLRASLDILVARTASRTDRPLLNDGNSRQTLRDLIGSRHPVYAEADIIIDTGDEPMAITLQSVLDALQKIES